jgi:mono/diheme cytochrome c family protein
MKRWLPFTILVLGIIALMIFLIFTGQDDDYVPLSSDPAVVYKEACARCHGERGQGERFLYPDLSEEYIEIEKTVYIVRNGELFMPAFPNIPDSTLNRLAEFIAKQRYKE